MSEITIVEITIYSTSLIHASGALKYAQTAYKTNDRKVAIDLANGLTNNVLTEPGVLALLQNLFPTQAAENGNVTAHIPSYWIAKDASEES